MADNIDTWKWIHQQLTDQIDREFELLSQRMNWLLTSNAFLFTVTSISIGINDSSKFFHVAVILILGAAGLGLLICVLSHMVMKAARSSILERKTDRCVYEEKIRQEFEFDFNITVPANASHIIGNSPYFLLPTAIALIWIVIILSIMNIDGYISWV